MLIDPDGKEPYRLVEPPTRRVDFALDPADPRNAYILTEDGDLHGSTSSRARSPGRAR